MLKSDVEWPISGRYSSDSEWKPIGFFSEGLCNSTQFDLLLGFFASSAISVLSSGFATFLYNGGKMRLIINDILSEEDKNAVNIGLSTKEISAFDLSDIFSLQKTLSERDKHFFDCLAWLIRNNRIDIKVIAPKHTIGISHTKCGLFSDGLNKVAFDGSCNFSKSALIDNLESISSYCEWDSTKDKARVEDIEMVFNKTFSGDNNDVIYLSPNQIKTQLCDSFPNKELPQLLNDERELLKGQFSDSLPENIRKVLNKALKKVEDIIHKKEEDAALLASALQNKPCFPYPSPKDYQIQAYNSWKRTQQGLFAMATGTGKTITSLNCLLEIYKHFGYYKALILVPTIALVEQWERECAKFNFKNIYKVSSKNPGWQHNISNIKMLELTAKKNEQLSYIIISTYASYGRSTVFQILNGFPKSKLLLIADEAHNMGSGTLCEKLNLIPYKRRIGLSATPERQYDDIGNDLLKNFFGCSKEYTFSYTMQEAIEKNPPALCGYYYYPHIVHLTDAEMSDYIDISKKIVKFIGHEDPDSQETLKRLLLKRKRVIHKAENKKVIFKKIIEDRLNENGNLRYSLIYVPEGIKPNKKSVDFYDEYEDVFDMHEEVVIEDEDKHLIDEYTAIVRNADSRVTIRQFTSGTKERESILKDYASGNIDVLTSMKCLDEGVDVPRSEFTVFCSSTGNPRQFIQRRGRVLRLHKDKKYAIIHDLIVVPDYFSEETFQLEKSLVLGELKRVHEFALLSKNFHESIQVLDPYLQKYVISIFNT